MKNRPILFNGEMVRALLDGHKTVTRRAIKNIDNTTRFIELEENPSVIASDKHGTEYPKEIKGLYACFASDTDVFPLVKAPYRPGDILYVRETFFRFDGGGYAYKAESNARSEKIRQELGYKWRPSIHMPKKAARIFLRVTDVRVERLQDILNDPPGPNNQVVREGCTYGCDFISTWENTIKPADRALYGWEANPWVWVIEFERISREDARR